MERRTIYVIAAIAMAATVLAASVIVLNGTSVLRGEDDMVLIGFDVQAAEGHVRELVSNGPRMTGTEAELLGAEYIAAEFEEAGLEDVHIEAFQHMLFEVRSASVSLVEYGPMMLAPRLGGESFDYIHMQEFVVQGFSGSLSWSNFLDDMEVVGVGDGNDPSAFTAASGKACLVGQTRDSPSNNDLFTLAYESGARALVLQNLFQGEEIGYMPIFKSTMAPTGEGGYPDIPFFMVSREVGDQMLEMRASFKLRVDIDVDIGYRDVRVVVGDIKGDSGRMVVLGAHHDTCYNTIGVVDNTVGPATVIEIARSMAGYRTKDTVRFVTFGGEEEGLYGSTLYYDAHKEELDQSVELYMNFDMPHADAEARRVTITTTTNSSVGRLWDLKAELLSSDPDLKGYSINVTYDDMYWAGSDHWAFVSHGHDAMGGWGSGSAEYHTYLDNLDHLNAESLQVCGRIMGSYALHAAS